MSSYVSFETERLIIRPTTLDDAPFVYELLNTPQWLRYIGDRNIKSVGDAADFIKNKLQPQLERLGYSTYTVIRKSDRMKIGTCGLYDREGLEGIDIGFAFLPKFAKQGYAFEAANKLKEAAVNVFGITRLSGITRQDNFPSQKLLERLGLQYVQLVKVPNDDNALMLYQLKLIAEQTDFSTETLHAQAKPMVS